MGLSCSSMLRESFSTPVGLFVVCHNHSNVCLVGYRIGLSYTFSTNVGRITCVHLLFICCYTMAVGVGCSSGGRECTDAVDVWVTHICASTVVSWLGAWCSYGCVLGLRWATRPLPRSSHAMRPPKLRYVCLCVSMCAYVCLSVPILT